MTPLELANYYADKSTRVMRVHERRAYVIAFVHGWNKRHDREPDRVDSEWPSAYVAGFNEGWHAREKAELQ